MTGQKQKLLLLIAFIAVIAALRVSPVGKVLTFENLEQNRDRLVNLVQDHYGMSVATFIAVYVLATSLSLPGAIILTLAGGFLFGVAAGTFYVNIGATTGAVLAFLSARYLLGDRLQEKYAKQLETFNREMDRHGTSYLLTLRLIPVFPFFSDQFPFRAHEDTAQNIFLDHVARHHSRHRCVCLCRTAARLHQLPRRYPVEERYHRLSRIGIVHLRSRDPETYQGRQQDIGRRQNRTMTREVPWKRKNRLRIF